MSTPPHPELLQQVDNVAEAFRANDLSIFVYIQHIILLASGSASVSRAKDDLLQSAHLVCSALFGWTETRASILSWAFNTVRTILCAEIVRLTQPRTGLNFNAKNATLDFVEGSFMQEASDYKDEVAMEEVNDLLEPLDDAVDLGDIGGDDERDNENNAETRSKHRARARKGALIFIKTVVVISIIANSTSERCNYLQAILGIFFHSCSVPEKVIETLSHAGFCISLSTIHRAIGSLSEKSSAALKMLVRTLAAMWGYDNFDIKFKAAHPTLENPSTFVSATSATTIPLFGVNE
ncbi:hypothetical protein K435DRAFT_649791, partial [Dendrothele bispora CBS 962.96]